MHSNHSYCAVAIAAITVLSPNAPALEPPIDLTRAVQPIDGPADAGDHGGALTASDACPATNVGTLTNGSTIVGSTFGSADDFVAGCGSQAGGRDEIFEFSVDFAGEWSFDTCTVPACWDTTLSIREDRGGGCSGGLVACNGDGCDVCYYESAVSAFLDPTSTYYLIVDGWSALASGDFTVTALLVVPGCMSDAECDDGLFCNGMETCDVPTGLCMGGSKPCSTYEGYNAPCDEGHNECFTPDPSLVWQGGRGFSLRFRPGHHCPPGWWAGAADEIQRSHHTSDILEWYTMPIFSGPTADGSPVGAVYSINQALWTVEEAACRPSTVIAGTECTNTSQIMPGGGATVPMQCIPTSEVLLPNNSGDFGRCEIDFFVGFRTSEKGAGFQIAEYDQPLGGPGAADDFGVNAYWNEECGATGYFSANSFGDDENFPADFANVEVYMTPIGACCHSVGCSVTLEQDCLGTWTVGTIYNPASCDEDSDGDGVVDPCDQCPGEDDADGDDVCDDVDICHGFDDHADNDGDGVPDGCDECPGSDDGVGGAVEDDDGDGVLNCSDLCPGVDDAVFLPECKSAIPTTSEWGLVVLALLLLAGGKIVFGISAKRARSFFPKS